MAYKRLFVLIGLLSVSYPAAAYVDPNTGGTLYQLLAPLFLAIAAVWTFVWRSGTQILRRLRERIRSLLNRER